MRKTVCDKCGIEVIHPNRVHIYNYTVRVYGEKRRVNRPKRMDKDVCDECRKFLINWFKPKVINIR